MKRLLLPFVLLIALSAPQLSVAATGSAPTNVSPPVITGNATVGQTITVSNGTWTGSPTRFVYEFLECAAICSPGGSYSVLVAQPKNTYKLTSADAGHQVYAAVQATNAFGSTAIVANSTSIVGGTGTTGATSTTPGRNPKPDAAITISSTSGLTLTLTGSASVVALPATKLTFFSWNFGDGKTGTGRSIRHTYKRAGIYTLELTVTDNLGGSSSSARIARVG